MTGGGTEGTGFPPDDEALAPLRAILHSEHEVPGLRRSCGEHPDVPGYQHPECGFHWHGRDGLDIPLDGNREPRCPRCALAELENAIDWGTSCLSCATVLGSCAAETFRRERAEEFARGALRDAIRACEADVAAGDPEAPDFLAEYRDEFARLSRSLISAEPLPAALGGGITLGCDCGTTTHLVIEVEGVLTRPREVGVTCDGCLTTHWVTVCRGEGP